MSATEPTVSNTPLPPRFVGDLSQLAPHGHGPRSLTWWGMIGIVIIESTAFVLAGAAYLYLANQVPRWPPHDVLPTPLYGGLFTGLMLLSVAPNHWLKHKAEHEILRPVQIGLVFMSLVGLVLVLLRGFEFTALNVRWNDSAYGSIVWVLLGLHTTHLVTDLVDTLVLTALMFTQHAHGRRFVDVSENSIYWNFVVAVWPPIYVLLYFVPRWL